jgi:ABC-type nitrate/sulfonate/bicarbonate transport system ATPase subunit
MEAQRSTPVAEDQTAAVAAKLSIAGVSHRFGSETDGVLAISDFSLDVRSGSFVSIIGQSGCGKTTLFNILAGLLPPSSGQITLDGAEITGRAGMVSYMLQKDLLLPWRTVLDNVIFGMEIQGVSKTESRARALPFLERYGLEGFAESYPGMLSGGMRQRAALLRTLLCNKEVILLDEPFGALDAQTRLRMQAWLLTLWRDFGLTVLFITHDVDEAIFLSDEIVVLSPRPGRIRETLSVDLDRPRGRGIVTGRRFAALKAECLELLFEGEAGGPGEFP